MTRFNQLIASAVAILLTVISIYGCSKQDSMTNAAESFQKKTSSLGLFNIIQ